MKKFRCLSHYESNCSLFLEEFHPGDCNCCDGILTMLVFSPSMARETIDPSLLDDTKSVRINDATETVNNQIILLSMAPDFLVRNPMKKISATSTSQDSVFLDSYKSGVWKETAHFLLFYRFHKCWCFTGTHTGGTPVLKQGKHTKY